MKHNPKYSFSFRLKCEATKSSSSRDSSLGWKVSVQTQFLYVNAHGEKLNWTSVREFHQRARWKNRKYLNQQLQIPAIQEVNPAQTTFCHLQKQVNMTYDVYCKIHLDICLTIQSWVCVIYPGIKWLFVTGQVSIWGTHLRDYSHHEVISVNLFKV